MRRRSNAQKRILTVGKMKGDGSQRRQVFNLAAMRSMLFDEATRTASKSGRLGMRQLDHIHAVTGVPWTEVNKEAEKEGL